MIYTFFSSVFITLFLIIPFNWLCAHHVIILAVLAVLCFIIAVIFGIQIPESYVH